MSETGDRRHGSFSDVLTEDGVAAPALLVSTTGAAACCGSGDEHHECSDRARQGSGAFHPLLRSDEDGQPQKPCDRTMPQSPNLAGRGAANKPDTTRPWAIQQSGTLRETATSTRRLRSKRMFESGLRAVRGRGFAGQLHRTIFVGGTRPCQPPVASRTCYWNSKASAPDGIARRSAYNERDAARARVRPPSDES